jgi:hypothetical protein
VEKKLGLGLNDLERVTYIVRSTHAKDSGYVLRTSKPISRKKVFATFSTDKVERKHGNFAYFVLDKEGNTSMVLHFVNDNVVLATDNEDAMKDFLSGTAKPATDPAVTRGIKAAASGSYAVVAAYRVSAAMANELFPGARLGDMTGLVLTGTVDRRLDVEVACIFPSSDAAANGRRELDAHPPKVMFEGMTIDQRGSEIVIRAGCPVPVWPAVAMVQRLNMQSPGMKDSRKNLDRIGQAIRDYENATGKLPPHGTKARLSWRVAILPYLDGQAALLARDIRMDEPWDSKHNLTFAKKMPKVYQLPAKPSDSLTYYQVFRGTESPFPDEAQGPVKTRDVQDQGQNTLFVIEAAEAVQWMKPDDIPFKSSPRGLSPKVVAGNHWGDDTFLGVLGTGFTMRMSRKMDPTNFQALIMRAGGERIDARRFDLGDRDGEEPIEP